MTPPLPNSRFFIMRIPYVRGWIPGWIPPAGQHAPADVMNPYSSNAQLLETALSSSRGSASFPYLGLPWMPPGCFLVTMHLTHPRHTIHAVESLQFVFWRPFLHPKAAGKTLIITSTPANPIISASFVATQSSKLSWTTPTRALITDIDHPDRLQTMLLLCTVRTENPPHPTTIANPASVTTAARESTWYRYSALLQSGHGTLNVWMLAGRGILGGIQTYLLIRELLLAAPAVCLLQNKNTPVRIYRRWSARSDIPSVQQQQPARERNKKPLEWSGKHSNAAGITPIAQVRIHHDDVRIAESGVLGAEYRRRHYEPPRQALSTNLLASKSMQGHAATNTNRAYTTLNDSLRQFTAGVTAAPSQSSHFLHFGSMTYVKILWHVLLRAIQQQDQPRMNQFGIATRASRVYRHLSSKTTVSSHHAIQPWNFTIVQQRQYQSSWEQGNPLGKGPAYDNERLGQPPGKLLMIRRHNIKVRSNIAHNHPFYVQYRRINPPPVQRTSNCRQHMAMYSCLFLPPLQTYCDPRVKRNGSKTYISVQANRTLAESPLRCQQQSPMSDRPSIMAPACQTPASFRGTSAEVEKNDCSMDVSFGCPKEEPEESHAPSLPAPAIQWASFASLSQRDGAISDDGERGTEVDLTGPISAMTTDSFCCGLRISESDSSIDVVIWHAKSPKRMFNFGNPVQHSATIRTYTHYASFPSHSDYISLQGYTKSRKIAGPENNPDSSNCLPLPTLFCLGIRECVDQTPHHAVVNSKFESQMTRRWLGAVVGDAALHRASSAPSTSPEKVGGFAELVANLGNEVAAQELPGSNPSSHPRLGGVAGRISLNARDAVVRIGQLENRGTMTLEHGEDPEALAISRDSIIKMYDFDNLTSDGGAVIFLNPDPWEGAEIFLCPNFPRSRDMLAMGYFRTSCFGLVPASRFKGEESRELARGLACRPGAERYPTVTNAMKRLPSDAPTVSTGTTMESLFRVQAVSILPSSISEQHHFSPAGIWRPKLIASLQSAERDDKSTMRRVPRCIRGPQQGCNDYSLNVVEKSSEGGLSPNCNKYPSCDGLGHVTGTLGCANCVPLGDRSLKDDSGFASGSRQCLGLMEVPPFGSTHHRLFSYQRNGKCRRRKFKRTLAADSVFLVVRSKNLFMNSPPPAIHYFGLWMQPSPFGVPGGGCLGVGDSSAAGSQASSSGSRDPPFEEQARSRWIFWLVSRVASTELRLFCGSPEDSTLDETDVLARRCYLISSAPTPWPDFRTTEIAVAYHTLIDRHSQRGWQISRLPKQSNARCADRDASDLLFCTTLGADVTFPFYQPTNGENSSHPSDSLVSEGQLGSREPMSIQFRSAEVCFLLQIPLTRPLRVGGTATPWDRSIESGSLPARFGTVLLVQLDRIPGRLSRQVEIYPRLQGLGNQSSCSDSWTKTLRTQLAWKHFVGQIANLSSISEKDAVAAAAAAATFALDNMANHDEVASNLHLEQQTHDSPRGSGMRTHARPSMRG
ncbi:uncharacterized protein CLUP02_14936 [Colletotrichum lupini]|uniref:Uncharacterized protein n=1 Tax=Colletotrichum lupini TaxID=145971 RepID=A0A9Q8WNI9_9PEZI|nr:uncharacterized protein CLUP02_14936 [Colletotrichum lupini]UQC89407.1 hypothetical protein CLUP02_14936 [Colletotrichum lupini]